MRKYILLLMVVFLLAGCSGEVDPVACDTSDLEAENIALSVELADLQEVFVDGVVELEACQSELIFNIDRGAAYKDAYQETTNDLAMCDEVVIQQNTEIADLNAQLTAMQNPTPTPTPPPPLDPCGSNLLVSPSAGRPTAPMYTFTTADMNDDPIHADHPGYAYGAFICVHPDVHVGAYGLEYYSVQGYEAEQWGVGWWLMAQHVDIRE